MKVYTIKDEEGNLKPQAILKVSTVSKSVLNGQIIEVDYGLEDIKTYLKKNPDCTLAICNLISE